MIKTILILILLVLLILMGLYIKHLLMLLENSIKVMAAAEKQLLNDKAVIDNLESRLKERIKSCG